MNPLVNQVQEKVLVENAWDQIKSISLICACTNFKFWLLGLHPDSTLFKSGTSETNSDWSTSLSRFSLKWTTWFASKENTSPDLLFLRTRGRISFDDDWMAIPYIRCAYNSIFFFFPNVATLNPTKLDRRSEHVLLSCVSAQKSHHTNLQISGDLVVPSNG